MPASQYIRPGDNPDITKERRTCTFDPSDLAAEIYGGQEILKRKREIAEWVASEPAFANPVPVEFLTREKKIEEAARKTRALAQLAGDKIDVSNLYERNFAVNDILGHDGFPTVLHFTMFIPALEGQAHAELADEFLTRAYLLEINGTYAQTEMGHGTNLKELETTATYDKKTQEFVLHTPTTKAMKWWPGNLGKVTNYAIVTAQLYTNGRCHGPHNFLVQLRDEKTHVPLKGVTVGDIGPKLGYNTTDNGFLAFDHYRIPRGRMLMKHAKVDADGTYTPPKHAKANYGAMVYVRSVMTKLNAYFLSMASTIAIRYSTVRRQGHIEQGQQEVQILDYQTQQYRLFPQLALSYAMFFTGSEVLDLYSKLISEMSDGNNDLLPDLHALTSGLKSVVTFQAAKGVEQCRMACGGHGYSLASGIPQIFATQVGGCTYEGENMVMLQQVARYLVKCVAQAKQGKPLSRFVAYLGRKDDGKSRIGSVPDALEHEELLRALEHAARRLSFSAAEMLAKKAESGLTPEEAWNECTVELNRAARVHTRLFIAATFHRRVTNIRQSLKAALTDLLSLHLHYECVDMAQHLLEDGFCVGWQIAHLKTELYSDLAKIRPNAVGLVDAFEYSDRELNSILGRRDGNVYEALYDWAKKSQLNYTDVLPAVTLHMKPMMEENRAMSKL